MKKSFLTLSLLAAGLFLKGQTFHKPSDAEIKTLPAWAQYMYGENPNVFALQEMYEQWVSTHPSEKNYHTQHYKRWMKVYSHYCDEQGNLLPFASKNTAANNSLTHTKKAAASAMAGGPWQLLGPFTMNNDNGQHTGEQTNVYCIDQNENNPQILYAGTEPGDIFKSTNGGNNWTCVSFDLRLEGIGAIETDPTNANLVFAGSTNFLVHSANGGTTWDTVLNATGFYPNEILIDPANTQNIFVASENGFYKSTDGGINWTKPYNEKCYDVKFRPGNSSAIYLLKNNPTLGICEFLLSTDGGNTFAVQSNGWYSSSDPARVDMGGRIAVSAADTARVYAYLIGDAKANDYGYIGVYRSNDGGVNWTLPNGPAGGPYTTSHPNLAYGEPAWTYHQGYYNCAIVASATDADDLLIGGLNLWRSNDGGATFSSAAGYVGGPLDMHVDMQDFRTGAAGTWITNDGGIYFSNDFFVSDNNVKMVGVHGTDLWGFDCGWNEDAFVGGAYHNGVVSYYQNYPAGDFLQLGGAEPASGYVNKGVNRKVVSNEVGGKILPWNLGTAPQNFSASQFPNESYGSAESSEMECYPQCYNMIYMGSENKLWKSDPASPYTFNLLYTFGTNTAAKVQHIEISRSNQNVLYVSQRPSSGSNGFLYKSTNGGQTFSTLTKPAGNSRRILLALNAENENELWMAYPSGANGNKIFKTTDGGGSWTNLSTTTLNNEEITSIALVNGTQGGIYAFTWRSVYYRNDTMNDWTEVNNNLPAQLKSNIARPFYRDGKIRIGTYGKGIWENAFEEQPTHPIAKAMADKLSVTQFCSTDTFHFEDYSILNHAGASWQWNFQGGTPSTSTQRNPLVTYAAPGTYSVVLIVTDSAGQSDKDTLFVNINQFTPSGIISEGFQASFPPANWFLANETNGGQWALSTTAGGFGTSTQCAIFDNYNFDSQAEEAHLYSAIDLSAAASQTLYFDRAYAEYGFPYSDTLRIDVSVNCGSTWNTVYTLGGSQLATAPQEQNVTFEPTASQWVTDSVDLSAYASSNNVLVRFTNIGYFGQALYIDNINLGSSTGIKNEEINLKAALYPNPAFGNDALTLKGKEYEQYLVKLFSDEGKLISTASLKSGEKLQLNDLATGNYIARIEGKSTLSFVKVIVAERRR